MDSPRNSAPLENIEENSKLENTFVEEELTNQNESNSDHLDLPEGVNYYPPQESRLSLRPTPTQSVRSFQRSMQSLHQWHALSLPKSHHLEDNIQSFKEVLDDEKKDNLKRQLSNHKILREVTGYKYLNRCADPPATPQLPSSRRKSVDAQKREEIMRKFNARLKRDAFDRLMAKVFTELPRLVLEEDVTNMSKLPPSTQQMVNVIFSTLIDLGGKPLTAHDHELYCHLAVGLARFIESVVDSVRTQVYSNASIVNGEDRKRQLRTRQERCSMTTGLLENLNETIVSIQRSREILKPKNPIKQYMTEKF